jgi:plastocyanin
MRRLRPLVLLLGLLAAPLQAAVHEVVLSGLSFTPSQLTIAVGDTVRWRNQSGFHDVVADDGSFRSGPPSAAGFVFERTFTTPGTFGYYCSVHGSPGEGMIGRIVVQGSAGAAPAIGRGLNGSWFNPATDGQGFLFEASADGVFTFAWFTWGDNGSYDWLTGAGAYRGNVATLSVTRSRGGRFNDPAPVSFGSAGSATFTLESCTRGRFEFTLTDPPRSGSIMLQKLLPAGPECQAPAPD